MTRRFWPVLVLGVALVWAGCSGQPTTPSTDQFVADVKANLTSMDYEAALKNLERLIKNAEGQPIAQQAVILRTALLTSMAEATKTMAEAYREGARQPRAARPGELSKMKSDYYGIARARLMSSMEGVLAQRAKLGAPMPFSFAFPEFSGGDSVVMAKIQKGQWVEDSERYHTELEFVRNELARTLAGLVGAGDDVAKGHAVFEKGGVQIDPRIYLLALSERFYKLSDMFDRRGLDDPRYHRITLEVVRDNMDIVLKMIEAQPDKDLETRAKKLKADCEKALKSLGG